MKPGEVLIVHSERTVQEFRPTARQAWKRQHSDARFQQRFGRPRTVYRGEFGELAGVRFIRSTP